MKFIKNNKEIVTKTKYKLSHNSRFTPATDLKIGTFVPNFTTQKEISKKTATLQKGPYQIIDKPTDVTYQLTHSSKKEIVQHRNNLLPYYPEEHALRKITHLYSFTGLKLFKTIQKLIKIKTLIKIRIKNQPNKTCSPPNIFYTTNKNISKRTKK